MNGLQQLAAELADIREQLNALKSGVGLALITDVNHDDNTVTVDTDGGSLDGVTAQAGYIPQVGHYATIVRNGMDLLVLPPQGPMTSPAPAATTGLVVTPGIESLVCSWDEALEANVKNNRGFYQTQSADDQAMTENVTSHIQAATKAVLTPVTAARWVQVRAINEAGVPGPYCDPVEGTPGAVPVSEPADGSITAAKLADAAVTAAKLANGAVENLALAPDAVESDNIAAGAVVADSIQAGAVGAAAIATYSIDATKLAAGSVTAYQLSAGSVTTNALAANSVTASILDANAINGKTITGVTITGGTFQTTSYGEYILMSSSQGNVIGFHTNGAYQYGTITGSGSQLVLQAPRTIAPARSITVTLDGNAGTVDVEAGLQIEGVPVPFIYAVQVAFYANGSSPFTSSVSYSCPFYPGKCVAVSNTQGAKIDAAVSIGQYGCVLQATAITGLPLAAGSLIYATLILSN